VRSTRRQPDRRSADLVPGSGARRKRAGADHERAGDAEGAGGNAQRQDVPGPREGSAEGRWPRRSPGDGERGCSGEALERREAVAGAVAGRAEGLAAQEVGGVVMANRRRYPSDDDERAVYIISVAAELAGVHPQTLRIYERKGLLRPKRTEGNTRRYSDADVELLRAIQSLTQEEGINLAGVKRIMEMRAQMDELRQRVDELQEQLAHRRA